MVRLIPGVIDKEFRAPLPALPGLPPGNFPRAFRAVAAGMEYARTAPPTPVGPRIRRGRTLLSTAGPHIGTMTVKRLAC